MLIQGLLDGKSTSVVYIFPFFFKNCFENLRGIVSPTCNLIYLAIHLGSVARTRNHSVLSRKGFDSREFTKSLKGLGVHYAVDGTKTTQGRHLTAECQLCSPSLFVIQSSGGSARGMQARESMLEPRIFLVKPTF